MVGGYYLQTGNVLTETTSNYTDVNEVLELYKLRKYIDNDSYLKDGLNTILRILNKGKGIWLNRKPIYGNH